jgi:hypothetical protein
VHSKFQPPPLANRSSPNTSPDNSMSSDAGIHVNNNNNNNNGGARWKVNGSGQVVDSEAEWLADDMVRLKIANGGSADEIASVQAKGVPNPAVVQLQEASPLESNSEASLASNSPSRPDQHLGLPSHNRGSSTDSTSSRVSAAGVPPAQKPATSGLKVDTREHRDRPHSYSGGLSTADLRRLQTAGGPDPDQGRTPGGAQEKGEPMTYPSLASNPRQAGSPDLQVDYNVQQRQFQPITVDTSRVSNGGSFRQPQQQQQQQPQQQQQQQHRSFNAQGGPIGPSAASMPYPMQPGVALGTNPQDLYSMMLPSHENPAVARVQQQHNVFRNTHQHSSSDPIHLRDAATAALINAGMQFAPGMYPVAAPPTVGLYPGQFFAPQEAYAPGVAQIMAAARMQQQFPQPYGLAMPTPQQTIAANAGRAAAQAKINAANLAIDPSGNGPSANNRKLGLYKTELCRSWEEKGTCRYGPKCQFAHGEDEIRRVARHPKVRNFYFSLSQPVSRSLTCPRSALVV